MKRLFWLILLILLLIPSGYRSDLVSAAAGLLQTPAGPRVELRFPVGNGFSDHMKHFDVAEKGLRIYYNFGAFSPFTSSFYDRSSDFYNTHFGAYVISGRKDLTEINELFSYDQTVLVLPALGKTDGVFRVDAISEIQSQNYAGFSDWKTFDVSLQTNGPLHPRKTIRAGYLQYGFPPASEEDFPPEEMLARAAFRYDEATDTTVCYYVMTKTVAAREEFSRLFLDISWRKHDDPRP